MYRIFFTLFLVASLGTSHLFAQAPPTNDNFTNAINLGSAVNFTVSGSNVGATIEATFGGAQEYLAGLYGDNSVWWTWTAPSDGVYTLSSVGSEIDTVFHVLGDAPVSDLVVFDPFAPRKLTAKSGISLTGGGQLRLGYGDDTREGIIYNSSSLPFTGFTDLADANDGYGRQSQAVFNATAGSQYWFVVHGFSATDEGNISLTLLQGENVESTNEEEILFRNTSTGAIAMWGMNFDYAGGFNLQEGGVFSPTVLPASWRIIQRASHYAPSDSEFFEYQLLLLHGPANQLVYWGMGGAVLGFGASPTPATGGSAAWRLCGISDGISTGGEINQLYWQNTSTGEIAIWVMDSADSFISTATVDVAAGPVNEIKVLSYASNVMWLQNSMTGQIFRWSLADDGDGTLSIEDAVASVSNPGVAWELLGSNEFAGEAQLFFRNRTTGQGASWIMDASDENVVTSSFWALSPPATWEVAPASVR